MLIWTNFIDALGKPESAPEFSNLVFNIGESAIASETPDEYNDPLGKTKYFQFYRSGLELGFREGRLNHVHLYVQPHESYDAYTGELIQGMTCGSNEASVIQALGPPIARGGGKPNMLIGYVFPWIKYNQDFYAIRMEFDKNNMLRLVSLMLT